MIYLKTFKLSESRSTDPNIYPFCIFKNKEPNIFVFDDHHSTIWKQWEWKINNIKHDCTQIKLKRQRTKLF